MTILIRIILTYNRLLLWKKLHFIVYSDIQFLQLLILLQTYIVFFLIHESALEFYRHKCVHTDNDQTGGRHYPCPQSNHSPPVMIPLCERGSLWCEKLFSRRVDANKSLIQELTRKALWHQTVQYETIVWTVYSAKISATIDG